VDGRREDDLGYLVDRLARLLRAEVAARLKPFGLTPPQWSVLAEVAADEGATAAAVAERIGFDRATVTGVVRRLKQDGWVTLDRDPADPGSLLLAPTDRARQEMPALRHAVGEASDRTATVLDPAETDRLLALLQKAVDGLAGPQRG
jgi:DNA-binding MarR family transcriptional regulator